MIRPFAPRARKLVASKSPKKPSVFSAVQGIDPETGFYYDDTKRYIEASTTLSAQDRHKVYEGNARRVFPRLDAALKAKGK